MEQICQIMKKAHVGENGSIPDERDSGLTKYNCLCPWTVCKMEIAVYDNNSESVTLRCV